MIVRRGGGAPMGAGGDGAGEGGADGAGGGGKGAGESLEWATLAGGA